MDRFEILRRIIAALFLPLFIGLLHLQVFSHRQFRSMSERNSIRTIYLDIPRGPILDRNGRVLARDRIGYNLTFIPHDTRDPAAAANLLADLLGKNPDEIRRLLTRPAVNPFEPRVLERDLGEQQVHLVEEQIGRLPGFSIQPGLVRDYPLGRHAAAVTGFLGEADRAEVERLRHQGVRPGDLVGRSGLEGFHDETLRGQRGGTQVEVNARGRRIRELGHRPSLPGNTLVTTIDARLQEIASEKLGDRAGSVVAICPNTGEVLAMVSKPTFDPSRPALSLGTRDNPFVNRVIQGQYAPGSVFKIITAVAGLENDIIRTIRSPDGAYLDSIRSEPLRRALVPEDVHHCKGRVEIGDRTFHCWREEGHGWTAYEDAMTFSCNIYFGLNGVRIGERRLLEYARKMGLGTATGLDLPGERPGLVPSPGFSGGALNLSIGQGALLATPMQLAVLVATVGNGGNIMQPYLLREMKTPEDKTVTQGEPRIRDYFFASWETMNALADSLREVVRAGTGRSSFLPGITVAGKTGTAQVAHRDLGMYSRANFVCWTEHRRRPLAVATVLEKAEWGAEAAIITGAILREYYALVDGREPGPAPAVTAEYYPPEDESADRDPHETGNR